MPLASRAAVAKDTLETCSVYNLVACRVVCPLIVCLHSYIHIAHDKNKRTN